MTKHHPPLMPYVLSDRYTQTTGRVFLTGTQALARIMMDQARRDKRAGLNTAGFISGYRGSPLGALDLELWRAKEQIAENRITFLAAVNEDLGATAVLGAQQASLDPDCEVTGVFSMWYGKGPGVDRSGDALKHGNAYGSAPKGGVLVVAGDDHGCVSSSMPHQSDVAFMSWFMPTLNPASVAEYLEFGEYGIALSRYSGTWVGFKAISETVESGLSFDLKADRTFALPAFDVPAGGLHIRRADLPSPEIETRMIHKLRAVETFAEANPIDRAVYDLPNASFGFVTTGKAHLDLMEALRLLGLDEATCRQLGIDIYKVGMVWPLARRDALEFVNDKREIMVVEEKRGIIESQFKEYFYDWPGHKPQRMVGKFDENRQPLVPWTGELSPLQLVPLIAARLHRFFPDQALLAKAQRLTEKPPVLINVTGATRTPYFCSGCPHNTSTHVPKGSRAASGIGCHVMASWMDRDTDGYAQMGGEGVPWVAASKFNGGKHIFQNLGEGTWYHSGSLAIRQAVAAGTNITYKILYNDAVAMTGGQPVDGPVSVVGIAQTCRAEGVARIALVSDDPAKFDKSDFPDGMTLHHRDAMDSLQQELREVPGVTVLIYEQTCATEKRRRRKRGKMEDPKRFAMINDLVCEGCGDCSVASNCLSVEPLETEFGRKRKVNLASCNKDFSCLNGFCPSFVTVTGADLRKKQASDLDITALVSDLPTPDQAILAVPFDLLVTGVGGTGVVTVGALVTMAAHLQGLGASVLDFTGFAQKYGTVLSYIRLGQDPQMLNQLRIDDAMADAVIGCDIVVSSAPKASVHYGPQTRIALNLAELPTGDLVLHRDADLRAAARQHSIAKRVGADNLFTMNANTQAEALLGDPVYANVMMLGFAWQKGMVPLSFEALKQAILLNGVAVDMNCRAFDLGRVLAHAPEHLQIAVPHQPETSPAADEVIDRRAAFLRDYQNTAYADRYRATIAAFQSEVADISEDLVSAAAKSLFKLMAYKDEYEVARLHSTTTFSDKLDQTFEGSYRINFHMSPPLLPLGTDAKGRPRKIQLGSWMRPVLRGLAKLRVLRGTPFDPFGYSKDRKLDRTLLKWFETLLITLAQDHTRLGTDRMAQILKAVMDIRGYGTVREEAAAEVQARINALLSTQSNGQQDLAA